MNNEIALIKNTSEAVKNFSDVIQKFLQPDPIDTAINNAHAELISNAINGKGVNPDAIDFLCGYKKLVKQQKRCKDIADKAKAFIENSAKPENIKEDWLEFFFDKARLVCTDDMQLIWAKLLAAEANKPGAINPSLLHTMSIMRYEQAVNFGNICRFAFREFRADGVNLLLFISTNREAYADSNINPDVLKELERLGLIECNFEKEYIFKTRKKLVAGNKLLTISGDPKNYKKIKAGNVKFTYDGAKLYYLMDQSYKEYNRDIFEFTIARFKSRNCTIIINDKEII